MSTAEIAYGLLACLEKLTGDRASGNVTVRSVGIGNAPAGNVALSKFSYAVPVMTSGGGQQFTEWDRPLRTVADVVATPAGVTVPVVANHGGVRSNIAAGTPIRWFPTVSGVELLSVVAAGGLTGGAEPAEDHAFRSLVWSQELPSTGPISGELLQALSGGRFPAGCLYWASSAMDDESGQRQAIRTDRWGLVVVVDKSEGHHARARQALTLLDLCHAVLLDRQGVSHVIAGRPEVMRVSSPGIQVRGRRPRQSEPGYYCYEIIFDTYNGVRGIDNPTGVWADWLRTKYDFPTMASETGTHPSTLAVVEGATYPQP